MKNEYSFIAKIQLAFQLIITKLWIRSARLIRFPIDVRGKKHIDFGKGITIGRYCRFEAFAPGITLTMKNGIQINDFVHITATKKVEIGNNVLIASKVYISDTAHGDYTGNEQSHPEIEPKDRKLVARPVTIEDNAWIGESVSVLPGTTIGKGSIVGANSVVTKPIPPYSIAVGSPAKVIKKFNNNTATWEKV